MGNKKMKKMKEERSKRMIFIIGIFFVLNFISFISAIGITPGRTSLNFESNLVREVPFFILNSEHKDMAVTFMVEGDFAEWISLSDNYADFSFKDDSKAFSYTVNMPSSMDKPGKYEAKIVALEISKDVKEQGAFVGSTVSVVSQLYVYVSYPNKYVEPELSVVGDNEKTVFFVSAVNRGDLDISELDAIIDVYSDSGERIATLRSEVESLSSRRRKELVLEWDADVVPGKYKANVALRYDDEVNNFVKEFNVGEKFLEILEVDVKDFRLGEIAKFEAFVENKWSTVLENAYLNIVVYNDEDNIMADFKSPVSDIDSFGKSELVAYWDTVGVEEGTYDGEIVLRYGESFTEKNIQLKITEDSIEVMGITGRVIVDRDEEFDLNKFLIILVVFLIVVNIVWFVIIKRLIKKRK